jgi:hypothetical protein
MRFGGVEGFLIDLGKPHNRQCIEPATDRLDELWRKILETFHSGLMARCEHVIMFDTLEKAIAT